MRLQIKHKSVSDSATGAMSRDGDPTDCIQNVTEIPRNDTGVENLDWWKRTFPFIRLYSIVLIVSFGVAGNSFSIVVFVSSFRLRRSSTIQFLIALAITDSLCLIGDLFFVLSGIDWQHNYLTPITFVSRNNIGCKSVMWLRYRFVPCYFYHRPSGSRLH